MLPIALAHFNQVSTIGVLANLAVVPLAGIATVVGLAGVALTPLLEAAGSLLLNAVWPVLLALRASSSWPPPCRAPSFTCPRPPGPPWSPTRRHWFSACAPGRCAAGRRARARRLAIASAALGLTAMVIEVWPLVRPPDGRLRITVLDVGQGDAIVLEAPDGRAALVDAGPGGPHRLDTGERVVAPFLWNRGHLSLAAAIATHADLDHAGGLGAIRRLFRVTESGAAEALVTWARRAGVGITVLGEPGFAGAGAARRQRVPRSP